MSRRLGILLLFLLLFAPASWTQQAAPPARLPPPLKPADPAFLRAADEVLEEMSQLLALPVKSPLAKSMRTRDEIRAYVIRQIQTREKLEKREADRKALERFGLIPKGFDLEGFLTDLLTEQIAGLYDPKSREFLIADWIEMSELRMVMAHELVHALHDQHFNVDAWLEAAKPNDDALTARDAVLEGAAIGGMIDYLLRDQKRSIRDLPDLETFIRTGLLGEIEKSPALSRAPLYLREALLFPYLAGTTFTQRVLQAHRGWADFPKIFQNPPVSTQQILHPDLYLAGIVPEPVPLPDLARVLPKDWKVLDENILGEFGLRALLRQYLDEQRGDPLAAAWQGDRYAIAEHQKSKQTLLIFRLHLASIEDTARFFGRFSEALEKKHPRRAQLSRRPHFFSFEAPHGGVFLRCYVDECLTVEGADRNVFDRIARALGWPAAPSGLSRGQSREAEPRDLPPPAAGYPREPQRPGRTAQKTTVARLPAPSALACPERSRGMGAQFIVQP